MPALPPAVRKTIQQLTLALVRLRPWCGAVMARWAWFLRINVFFVVVFTVSWAGVSHWADIQYFVLNGSPSKSVTVHIAEEEASDLYRQWKYSRYNDYLKLLLLRVEELHRLYPQSRAIKNTLDKMSDRKAVFLKRSNNHPFFIFNFKFYVRSK